MPHPPFFRQIENSFTTIIRIQESSVVEEIVVDEKLRKYKIQKKLLINRNCFQVAHTQANLGTLTQPQKHFHLKVANIFSKEESSS